MESIDLIATSTFGLERVVARELQQLGITDAETRDSKILFKGTPLDVCRTNLWLRSADRVLIHMASFEAKDFDTLFESTKALPWENWLTMDAKFPVTGKSVRSVLHSTPHCQSIVKKAIVERLKKHYQRHWFDETGPEYKVDVHIMKDQVVLSIDTSGPGLHKRGYREKQGTASLKETLAAGLLQLSVWKPGRPFWDPFCGSGTIPIEAAMIGCQMAPGMQRSFTAEDWPQLPPALWNEARTEARDLRKRALPVPAVGSDIDRQMIKVSEKNAQRAGVSGSVQFHTVPFEDVELDAEFGTVVTNPPYAHRIGDAAEVEELYREMGRRLKYMETWSTYVLTANANFEALYDQEATRKRKLYNGRIECHYFQYVGKKPPHEEEAERQALLAAEEAESPHESTDYAPDDSESVEEAVEPQPVAVEEVPVVEETSRADAVAVEESEPTVKSEPVDEPAEVPEVLATPPAEEEQVAEMPVVEAPIVEEAQVAEPITEERAEAVAEPTPVPDLAAEIHVEPPREAPIPEPPPAPTPAKPPVSTKKLLIYPPIDRDRLKKIQFIARTIPVVNAHTEADALREIADSTAFFGKLTPELLAKAKRLEWVQSPTASLEHYLFPELIEHPCVLSNMRGLFNDVIADHVLGYILCFARNLHLYLRRQQGHRWEPIGGETSRPGVESGPGIVSEIDRHHLHLADCTLGIVGVGNIGAEIARRGDACGMTLCGVDPIVRRVDDLDMDVWPTEQLPKLLAESDFVVIAAPHTPATEKLFRTAQFEQMQNSAYLINIGRGVIVDLADLTSALQNQQIAGAALDVFETEPLPPEHPLWEMENVLITPHVAAASPKISERHLDTYMANLREYLAGRPPLTRVNKSAWF